MEGYKSVKYADIKCYMEPLVISRVKEGRLKRNSN